MSTLDAKLDTLHYKEPTTYKELTEQEIFDKVVGHLFKQGKRATRWTWCRKYDASTHSGWSDAQDYTETCAYRSDEGLKCAIGILIPDGLYDKKMEGIRVAMMIEDYELPAYFKNNAALLDSLQQAHDNPDNWVSKGRLRLCRVFDKVARENGLRFDRGQYNV